MSAREPSVETGDSVGRHMARGALWMVGMRWVIRVIGLVNTAILARVLVPEDFGIVALAMIAVDLIVTVTDGDVEMALVRSTEPSRGMFETGWTLKILAAMLTCSVLWLLAPLVAAHFQDSRIEAVVRIAALRPLIMGFENIRVAEFRRTLRFSAEFRYLVAQRLLSFLTGLVLVFSFRNYFALAWSMPVAALSTVALSYWIIPAHPRLSLTHWREFWRFSRWQMVFNSGRLIGERCDQFVIGRIAGAGDTGVYAVGFDLAMMPTREIMFPAGRALMPAYAKIAHDEIRLRRSFGMVLGYAVVIASSVGIGMSCIAHDATVFVLGAQWEGAVSFVRWLGIFGALEGAWLMLDPFFIAARREKVLALSNLLFSAITVPAVIFAAMAFGIGEIPFARIAVMLVFLCGVFFRMVRWEWISLRDLLGLLWRPLIASAVMASAIGALQSQNGLLPVISLLRDIAAGAVVYLAVLFSLWRLAGCPEGAEKNFIEASAGAISAFFRAGRDDP